MKIGDHLYFAPGVRFADLDADSPDLVGQFHSRIDSYYLAPARLLSEHGDYFASVLLLASAIDAIARYALPPARSGERYVAWLQTAIPSLSFEALAAQFYGDFRCGLVHEGRAKRACAFTPLIGRPVAVENGAMAVNPELFAEEVSRALDAFCSGVASSADALATFQSKLKADFQHELSN